MTQKKMRYSLILAVIFWLSFVGTASADYTSSKWFPESPVSYTSRNAYVEQAAFSYLATTTQKISRLTVVLLGAGSSADVVAALAIGDVANFPDNVTIYATSTNIASIPIGIGTAATTTFLFPDIDVIAGQYVTFFFASDVSSNVTIVYSPNTESVNYYPAWVLSGGEWVAGNTISSDYKSSYFYTEGTGDPYEFPIPNEFSFTPECTFTDVGACVGKALAWAFVPSSETWHLFTDLKDDLKDKAPFGYFTSAIEAIGGIEGSTTPAFLIATSSSIMTYIFNPLRTGLLWLIYIASIFWIYKRVTNVQA